MSVRRLQASLASSAACGVKTRESRIILELGTVVV